MTARTHTEPATLHARLATLRQERRAHARQTEAAPGTPNTTTTGDGAAAFFTLDAAAYYERLTGHIEEVAYLIELAEQQAKR